MPRATLVAQPPEVAEFKIADDASAVGMMVHNLPLPEGCLVVAIRRGAAFIVPHGPTPLPLTYLQR